MRSHRRGRDACAWLTCNTPPTYMPKANDEASCTAAAAKGGACTWFADGNTCQANYTLSLADDAVGTQSPL